MSTETFQQWARTITCASFQRQRDIVTIKETATLPEALALIQKLRVHSLPVITSDASAVLGMVDVLDICCSIFDLADFKRFSHGGAFNPGEVAEAFIDTRKIHAQLDTVKVKEVMMSAAPSALEESIEDTFEGPSTTSLTVGAEDDLGLLLHKLGKEAKHRVPVVSGSRVVDVITQSDLISFLYANKDKIPEAPLLLEASAIMTKQLRTINHHAAVVQALWMFRSSKVSAIAVEDNSGAFVGTIQALDFVGRCSDFSTMALAVDEFLAEAPKPTTCSPVAKVGEILQLMMEHKKHRVWVVEPFNAVHASPESRRTKVAVVGVVTLRDIILLISKTCNGMA